MKVSMKFTVTFILLVLVYGMSMNAVNLRKCVLETESVYEYTEASDTSLLLITSSNNKSRGMIVPSSMGLHLRIVETYFSSNYRPRRIIQRNNDALKNDRRSLFTGNTLVSNQHKVYYSDNRDYCISGDYYVFGLRRILI